MYAMSKVRKSFRIKEHREKERVTEKSIDATRRMLGLCEDTTDAGINTLTALSEQGEKLENIEKKTGNVHDRIKEDEDLLPQLEKSNFSYWLCGCCGNSCPRPCHKESEDEDPKIWNESRKIANSQPKSIEVVRRFSCRRHSLRLTTDRREAELDRNMEQVSSMVNNIRNVALDTGGEIDAQNRQLDRINRKLKSNQIQVKGMKERERKLVDTEQ